MPTVQERDAADVRTEELAAFVRAAGGSGDAVDGPALQVAAIRGPTRAVLVAAARDGAVLVLQAPAEGRPGGRRPTAARLLGQVQCPVVVVPADAPTDRRTHWEDDGDYGPGPDANTDVDPLAARVRRAGVKLGVALARSAATAGRPGVARTDPPAFPPRD